MLPLELQALLYQGTGRADLAEQGGKEMNTILLVGAEAVTAAAAQMARAAQEMQNAASRIEFAMDQRRTWEEEYLARIEAIVREELDFYKASSAVVRGNPQEPA